MKTRRKTLIFELQLGNIERHLARNARFGAVTSVIACLWLRRLYGGSCKTFQLSTCQNVKIERRLARNARFEASTCVVSSFWLSSGSAVSMGEAAEAFFFNVSQEVVAFLGLRSVYRGSCITFQLSRCQHVKVERRLALNARLEAST